MKIQKLKLSEIQMCPEIQEIRKTNPVFISRYRQAMRNGDKFPPLLLESGTNKMVGGYHRYPAYEAEFGHEHEVEVAYRSYQNEVDMIADAVKDNSRHGNPLDGWSRRKAVIKMTELGSPPEEVAKVLGCSVKKIEEMAGMSVVYRCGNKKRFGAIKHGLEHITGSTVTKTEYANHAQNDRGVPARQQAQQLQRWLESGWVDINDAKTFSALEQLHASLETILNQ